MAATYFGGVREIALDLRVLGSVFPFWVNWCGTRDKRGRATKYGIVAIGFKGRRKEPICGAKRMPRADFFKLMEELGMWENPRTASMRKDLQRGWHSWRPSAKKQK